jgi:putative ABC transport system ATP-binding protein
MTIEATSVVQALAADDLRLTFGATPALRGLSITLDRGEVLALMGPSGSGKSTLLHCLAGILLPDTGEVRVLGESLGELSEKRRSELRLSRMGFVLQTGELVPELTLAENVALPLQLLGAPHREAYTRAAEMLDAVGLARVGDRRAGAVSGGEAQRAAVARALVHEPEIVFADEPTGSLDTVSGEEVLELLLTTSRQRTASVLMVTHDHRVAAHADRVVVMRDGALVAEGSP